MVLPGVGAAGQERLLGSRVLLLGAGGLGSPAALYLAAAGVGHLTIVDDDVVELSNLHRQVLHDTAWLGRPKASSAAARVAALNPEVRVREVRERLGVANARDLVRGHDVVIDGSDSFATRYAVNDACYFERVPLVYAALSRFDAQLSVFEAYEPRGDRPGASAQATPCYRCVYPAPPPEEAAPSCAVAGVWSPLAGVAGSLLASEALKLLLGVGEPCRGKLVIVDLAAAGLSVYEVALAKDPACALCGQLGTRQLRGAASP